MSERDRIYEGIRRADKNGDKEGVKRLAEYLKTMPADEPSAAPVAAGVPGQPVQIPGATPEQPPAPQSIPGAIATGIAEPAAQLATGAVATPVAGLSGLAAQLGKALGITDSDPAEIVRKVQSGLTYQPKTQAGQKVSGAIAYPFEKLAEGARWAGEKTQDVTGSAGAAATVDTALQALPMLLGTKMKLPGGQAASKAVQKSAAEAASKDALRAPENAVREAAAKAGYKLPASQASDKPGIMARVGESVTGKTKTAQKASEHNQGVTNDLTRQTLGLGKDEPITPDALTRIRKEQGKVYEELKQHPQNFEPTPDFQKAIADIQAEAAGFQKYKTTADQAGAMMDVVEDLSQATYAPGDAVMLLKKLRSDAQANATSAAAKGGDVVLAAKARAQKAGAQALEKMVDDNLVAHGNPDLMQRFGEARQKIAQTHTVEKALNPATGNVSAQKLAARVKAGKPTGGEMRTAGEFASSFPQSSRLPEGLGANAAFNPNDYAISVLRGPLAALKMAAKPLAGRGAVQPVKPLKAGTPQMQAIIEQILNNPAGLAPFMGGTAQQQPPQE
jgi:hypothetical protein